MKNGNTGVCKTIDGHLFCAGQCKDNLVMFFFLNEMCKYYPV